MIARILTTMLGLLVPSALSAQLTNVAGFQTGNQLYELCVPPDVVACTSYVIGTFDAVLVIETELLKTRIIAEPTICKPHRVTVAQVRAIAVQYMEQNPQLRHHSAASLVVSAFRNAFKC